MRDFFAAALHALCLGSIAYSRLGNGDHHAFHGLLSMVVLGLLAAPLRPGRLERRAWWLGVKYFAGRGGH